ncbi:hypothetical protein [Microcoleus sp. BROC3]|uniref:hypothetical protein n=1 Tax=Microcoleus sp. BROC3 TaxID=3055323 RepID=UPI002FD4903B
MGNINSDATGVDIKYKPYKSKLITLPTSTVLYIGLAENKPKADCTRLIEVLPGQRGHEKEVKLEIVVHL